MLIGRSSCSAEAQLVACLEAPFPPKCVCIVQSTWAQELRLMVKGLVAGGQRALESRIR